MKFLKTCLSGDYRTKLTNRNFSINIINDNTFIMKTNLVMAFD